MSTPVELSILWMAAKQDEEAAKLRRLALEEQMLDLFDAPLEGQKTHKVSDFKVVRTNKINYRVDLEKYGSVSMYLPQGVDLLKPTTNETAVKALRNKNVELFARVQPAILMAPAKPNFSISKTTV